MSETTGIVGATIRAVVTVLALGLGAYAVAVLDRLLRFGWRYASYALAAPLREAASLLGQEDLAPRRGDHFLFVSAPFIAVATAVLAALVLPVGPGASGFDPAIGLFYFIVLLSPFIIAIMNAGWSQNSKVGLFATFRAAAHLISYEVPLGFAAIGAPMAAESLAIGRIVAAQDGLWFGVWQPLGVAIYLVAALFVCFRHPFDGALAGPGLEGGVLAEYSGARLLLLRMALDAVFIVLMAMAVELFFGGWQGPLLPGPLWFALKTILLSAAVIALARLVPRLRVDQMLSLCWKVLVPASLVNIAIVGVLALFIVGGGQ